MTKIKILILLLLLAALILVPNGKAKGDVQVKQVQVTVQPEEIIVPLTPLQMIEEEFPDAPIMVHIAAAESRTCTNNVNPTSSARGCFQIIKSTWLAYKCTGDVLFPPDNIACARKIYDDSGTAPWNESKHAWGKYL